MESASIDLYERVEALKKVTVFVYPFTAVEKRDGIPISFGSTSTELWRLVSRYSDSLKNPFTHSPAPNFGAHTAETARTYDEEMRLVCKYFETTDQIDAYDEAVLKGSPLLNDRDQLVERCNSIFARWQVAKQVAAQMETSWQLFRKDRLSRLKSALSLYAANDLMEHYEKPKHLWWPSGKFMDVLRKEVEYLQNDSVLSDWYRVQISMIEVTGRPLFRLDEVSPIGEVVADDIDGRIANMLHMVGAA